MHPIIAYELARTLIDERERVATQSRLPRATATAPRTVRRPARRLLRRAFPRIARAR